MNWSGRAVWIALPDRVEPLFVERLIGGLNYMVRPVETTDLEARWRPHTDGGHWLSMSCARFCLTTAEAEARRDLYQR